MTGQTLLIPARPPFPNAELLVLVYPGALKEPEGFPSLFRKNGWGGGWVNGVYAFDHFHAEAHEVLGCVSGWARLRLGGPEGVEVRVQAGDAVLLPAGMGHRNLAQSPDFRIAGAYPPGQSPDLQRGSAKDYATLLQRARAVPLPERDPVSGEEGLVQRYWGKVSWPGVPDRLRPIPSLYG